MKNERLHLLFQLYLDQKCTPAEETELMQLIAQPDNDLEREKLVSKCFDSLPLTYTLSKDDAEKIFNSIIVEKVGKIHPTRLVRNRIIKWVGMAAAVALIFITITFLLFRNNNPAAEINKVVKIAKEIKIEKPLYKNDIKPGGNKAILTLADGTKIILDEASKGAISRQGNTTIIKLDDGQLTYNAQTVSKVPSEAVLYNTLSTPRGGQYNVTLPDGTVVWLNASTSLRFPTAFAGKERRVEIKGEAYFEVSKNEAMPFIVKAGNQEIKVLGTYFNVTAYSDEKTIKTTLLEGSVEVTLTGLPKTETEKTNNIITLKPGEQSQLESDNTLKVMEADVKEAVAWKDGYFVFNDENIESIMLKIARWYDIKVVYEINPENQNFTANISRKKNVSEVLAMLELTNAIHFQIENKTITIMP
jgi:transmembrane sensor